MFLFAVLIQLQIGHYLQVFAPHSRLANDAGASTYTEFWDRQAHEPRHGRVVHLHGREGSPRQADNDRREREWRDDGYRPSPEAMPTWWQLLAERVQHNPGSVQPVFVDRDLRSVGLPGMQTCYHGFFFLLVGGGGGKQGLDRFVSELPVWDCRLQVRSHLRSKSALFCVTPIAKTKDSRQSTRRDTQNAS